MPESVGGVPIHPLVVHAVVVLIPLTAFGVAVLSVVPKWRPRYGVLVAITGVVAAVLAPIAKLSGENLKDTLGETDLVNRHADLGTNVLYGAVPLAVMAVVLWWLGRRAEHGQTGTTGGLAARWRNWGDRRDRGDSADHAHWPHRC